MWHSCQYMNGGGRSCSPARKNPLETEKSEEERLLNSWRNMEREANSLKKEQVAQPAHSRFHNISKAIAAAYGEETRKDWYSRAPRPASQSSNVDRLRTLSQPGHCSQPQSSCKDHNHHHSSVISTPPTPRCTCHKSCSVPRSRASGQCTTNYAQNNIIPPVTKNDAFRPKTPLQDNRQYIDIRQESRPPSAGDESSSHAKNNLNSQFRIVRHKNQQSGQQQNVENISFPNQTLTFQQGMPTVIEVRSSKNKKTQISAHCQHTQDIASPEVYGQDLTDSEEQCYGSESLDRVTEDSNVAPQVDSPANESSTKAQGDQITNSKCDDHISQRKISVHTEKINETIQPQKKVICQQQTNSEYNETQVGDSDEHREKDYSFQDESKANAEKRKEHSSKKKRKQNISPKQVQSRVLDIHASKSCEDRSKYISNRTFKVTDRDTIVITPGLTTLIEVRSFNAEPNFSSDKYIQTKPEKAPSVVCTSSESSESEKFIRCYNSDDTGDNSESIAQNADKLSYNECDCESNHDKYKICSPKLHLRKDKREKQKDPESNHSKCYNRSSPHARNKNKSFQQSLDSLPPKEYRCTGCAKSKRSKAKKCLKHGSNKPEKEDSGYNLPQFQTFEQWLATQQVFRPCQAVSSQPYTVLSAAYQLPSLACSHQPYQVPYQGSQTLGTICQPSPQHQISQPVHQYQPIQQFQSLQQCPIQSQNTLQTQKWDQGQSFCQLPVPTHYTTRPSSPQSNNYGMVDSISFIEGQGDNGSRAIEEPTGCVYYNQSKAILDSKSHHLSNHMVLANVNSAQQDFNCRNLKPYIPTYAQDPANYTYTNELISKPN